VGDFLLGAMLAALAAGNACAFLLLHIAERREQRDRSRRLAAWMRDEGIRSDR
jgi:hypothetical protein